jgi:mercuric ion transport protein
MKRNVADFGGATGAVLAALCCSGNALIVGALAAVGLGFLKNDAVLWPLMLGSLVVALYGFWRGWRMHGKVAPMILGALGALSLAAGVIVVHGPPAMTMIYSGSAALLIATLLNQRARAVCLRSNANPGA